MPGRSEHDEVKQDDLARMADLQASAYEAQMNCSRMALQIEKRIKAGACVEYGAFTWDKKLRMARSRKEAKDAKEA